MGGGGLGGLSRRSALRRAHLDQSLLPSFPQHQSSRLPFAFLLLSSKPSRTQQRPARATRHAPSARAFHLPRPHGPPRAIPDAHRLSPQRAVLNASAVIPQKPDAEQTTRTRRTNEDRDRQRDGEIAHILDPPTSSSNQRTDTSTPTLTL